MVEPDLPELIDSDVLPEFTAVTYHGSLEGYRGMRFWASECVCASSHRDCCGKHELEDEQYQVVIRHVRRSSITPVPGNPRRGLSGSTLKGGQTE